MDWGSVPPLLTVAVTSVAALVGAMWAVVRVIRAEVSNAIHSRFDAMESRFDAMDYRFDAMDTKFEARFDAIDARFDGVDTKFEARFDAIDGRFDGVDKRIDGVDHRLDELRVDYRTLAQRIDRMIEGLPALQVT